MGLFILYPHYSGCSQLAKAFLAVHPNGIDCPKTVPYGSPSIRPMGRLVRLALRPDQPKGDWGWFAFRFIHWRFSLR